MTGTQTVRGQIDSPARPSDRQRLWGVADWLLVVAALSSAGWAWMAAAGKVAAPFPRSVVLDSEMHNAEAIWFIDEVNVIHWSAGSAEGATSLTFAVTSVPADVLVLVHPDSLIEPLMRTIDVLQQAGAQQVHVALSRNAPFSRSD